MLETNDSVTNISQDALKRAEALERARSSEQRFLRFLDDAPMAISIVDWPSLAHTYVNHFWFDLTGHEKVSPEVIDWASIVADEGKSFRYPRQCDNTNEHRSATGHESV